MFHTLSKTTVLFLERQLFHVIATTNNLHNDWLYASAATKNKDVGAKHLRIRTVFSQLLMVTYAVSKLSTPV